MSWRRILSKTGEELRKKQSKFKKQEKKKRVCQEENGLWECEYSEGNYCFKKYTVIKGKRWDSSLSRKKKLRKSLVCG